MKTTIPKLSRKMCGYLLSFFLIITFFSCGFAFLTLLCVNAIGDDVELLVVATMLESLAPTIKARGVSVLKS